MFGAIIIDAESLDKIGDHELDQMSNDLRITGLQLGYILNVKHEKLGWKRVVLSPERT